MDRGLPEGYEPRLGGEEDGVTAEAESFMDTAPPTAQKTPMEGTDAAHDPPVTAAAPLPPAQDDEDDDVVLVEAPPPAPASQAGAQPSAPSPKHDCGEKGGVVTAAAPTPTAKTPTFTTPAPAPTTAAPSQSETIVIDDEEDSFEQKDSSSRAPPSEVAPPSGSAALSSTEPDSEIKIASVTTLGVAASSSTVAVGTAAAAAGSKGDMNLMITSVTSLQGAGAGPGLERDDGLQIGSTFSLNPEAQTELSTSRPGTFNPGRVGTTNEPVQNGETSTHQRSDSWISQSASFPRNQKQPGADSPAPAASLPKQVCSPSSTQQPPRTVKVTCANCRKPLKKGQTAYQRKGSTHLFCSTTCLSAFSHKPAPKKNCTMCKKDITSMKGTIVAQVDSSEAFQEFCSTGCLSSYENKQNPPKTPVKTRCTVCGKLTEIRHEVSFKNVTHKICSDMCFNRYRMANGLIMNCCEHCGGYLPSKANHFLVIDGQQKRFCSHNCVKDYKQAHGKMTICSGCKTSCRSITGTHCIGTSGAMETYCSAVCMAKTKGTTSPDSPSTTTEPRCHFCKEKALPQYQATLPEGVVYNFCSSSCVTNFQDFTALSTKTSNGQTAPSSTSDNIQLKCNYCRGSFSLKPQTLEWENKVYQFCSKTCCEDYKKLHCIVTFCEYCQEEKTLHETVKFSGVKRPFCSEGCKLLYKQEFARRLGLKCVTCNHCTQMCKRGVTKQIDGVQRDFCSEACAKKFHDWYYKSARCDCCKLQGNLSESVQWRAEMKHFCDQQCLLRFYCQQNEPNLSTQRGPENMSYGHGGQPQGTKATAHSQPAVPSSYAGGGMLKDVKNKAVLCKPLTLTKATYCKPHMQSKHCQTEEEVQKEYVPVPIPVPVYIPVPMNMYTQATPTPVTLPVPVPVPVFLPTTLDGAEQIVRTIAELKAKIPADPLEADLLAMAEMIAEADEEKPDCADVMCKNVDSADVKRETVKSESSSSEEEEEEEEEEDDSYQPHLDLEDDFPRVPDPVPAVEGLDAEIGFTLPLVLGDEREVKPGLKVERKGHKRRAVEMDASPSSPDSSSMGCSFPLKSRYGVNAWKRWVLTRNNHSQDDKAKEQLKEVKPSRLKRNLLSLSAAELNYGLSRFVSEVRRPNGEAYAPDSVFYLCLGIQRYLLDNGRTEDIFSDPYYHLFGQELNRVLQGWQPSVLPDGSLWGRVEEQALWSSRQLGQHSPIALLRSLVYLNTKYFGLRTVEQHLRLSFGKVYEQRKATPHSKDTSVCIRIPSISQDQGLFFLPAVKTGTRKRKREEVDGDPDYEPDEYSGSPPHCPIKKHECLLYELYLSKCPSALKKRTDVFYMMPDDSSSSDSPLWYSSTPLERAILEKVLTRILLIKDIYSQKDPSEEEEEEEGSE
ncbi:zinc finger MYM-type protein 2 [Anguilla rostrata]|uniref:zinc finger MYM-type protein 2 n=1 Tax=Anguilla rostrata TaxID=7938 RepID=UPI0030CD2ED9